MSDKARQAVRMLKKRFDINRLRWVPDKLVQPEIEQWLGGNDENWSVVKNTAKRSVYRFESDADPSLSLYLKYDHPSSPRDIIKTSIRPKVLREYLANIMLRDLGIPAVEPVACAWLGNSGILVTRAVHNTIPILELWRRIRNTPQQRERFLSALSELLDGLVRNNIWHPDFHWGNILAVDDDGGIKFYLIDAFGVRSVQALTESRISKMFYCLLFLLNELSTDEATTLVIPLTWALKDNDLNRWKALLGKQRIKKIRMIWRKRGRKTLIDSKYCQKLESDSGTWRLRNGFDLSLAESSVKVHKILCHNDSKDRIIDNQNLRVSKIHTAGTGLIVKEFTHLGRRLQAAADFKCWLNIWRLEMAGIPVARSRGWLRDSSGNAFVLLEVVEGVTVYDAMKDGSSDTDRLKRLIKGLRKLIVSLYALGIFHKKFTADNLVLVEADADNPETLRLVDNDNVAFQAKITQKNRDENCRQFIRSLPDIEAELTRQIEKIFLKI